MTGHGQKLSRKKESAIAALISLPTIGDAAKLVGIGEKTLFRWLQFLRIVKAIRIRFKYYKMQIWTQREACSRHRAERMEQRD
jgi:hypothetical protein